MEKIFHHQLLMYQPQLHSQKQWFIIFLSAAEVPHEDTNYFRIGSTKPKKTEINQLQPPKKCYLFKELKSLVHLSLNDTIFKAEVGRIEKRVDLA